MNKREHFGGRAAVIMALAGSAIGLGNIWRFPYLVGENGGAAFIVIYIFFTLVLSIPIFLAESAIGRSSRANCRTAIGTLVPGRAGRWLGLLMVITPLWIVSYYSVVGGWSLEYLWQSFTPQFTPFEAFTARRWAPALLHLLFLGLTVGIVAFGVKSGIEKFSKLSIPVLFGIIVLLAAYSVSLPGARAGVRYLLLPDFSQVTVHTFLNARGQSFYSLSLGMGIIITYSSYVSRQENLLVSGVGTAVSDLLFAYLAGFALLPAVFAAGIAPGSGPGLVFDTLPFIFTSMGAHAPVLSGIAAVLFFLAILSAALTSSISLIEVGVAYLTETRGMKRGWACVLLFGLCGAFGVLCSVFPAVFSFADSFASNVLLMLGGLAAVILVGWVMPREKLFAELTNDGSLARNVRLFPPIYFLIRYVAPAGILVLIITQAL